jgi:hypothetical protein
MSTDYHESDANHHPNPEVDYEAQQAARDAIMQINLFPDLPVALKAALGYGPHVDMIQHLVYWFHPKKRKMQNRWSLWKTFGEWKEECSLSERQVKKARSILAEKGLVTHTRGQYSRVFYRVDWVALAAVLKLEYHPRGYQGQVEDWYAEHLERHGESISDGITVQYEDFEDESISDGTTGQLHSRRYSGQVIPDANTVRLNTVDYAGDYKSIDSPLQVGGTPLSATPPPEEMEEKKEEKQPPTKPSDDKLLRDISEILDPKTSRWHHAKFIATTYPADTVAGYIHTNAEDIKDSEYVTSVSREELEAAIRYVQWQR